MYWVWFFCYYNGLNKQTLQNESVGMASPTFTLLIAQDTKIKLILRRPIFMWVYYPAPDSLSMWSAVQWTGIILYEQQARQGVFINFTSLIFSGCVGCNVKVQKLTGNIIQNTKSWKVFKLCTFQDIYWCFCERSS